MYAADTYLGNHLKLCLVLPAPLWLRSSLSPAQLDSRQRSHVHASENPADRPGHTTKEAACHKARRAGGGGQGHDHQRAREPDPGNRRPYTPFPCLECMFLTPLPQRQLYLGTQPSVAEAVWLAQRPEPGSGFHVNMGDLAGKGRRPFTLQPGMHVLSCPSSLPPAHPERPASSFALHAPHVWGWFQISPQKLSRLPTNRCSG